MSSRYGDKTPEPVTRTANNGAAKSALGSGKR
jgi:hypothetical protein